MQQQQSCSSDNITVTSEAGVMIDAALTITWPEEGISTNAGQVVS